MKIKLLIAIVIIVIGAFAIETKRLNNRPDDSAIVLSGNIEVTEVDAGFKIGGRIAKLKAEEGEKVEKDKILATLDKVEFENIVSQNVAYLNEKQILLEELKAGSRREDLEHAKANVSYADAELSKTKKDYERIESLYNNGILSAQQFDSAKKSYEAAVSMHKKSLESFNLVKAGPRMEEIKAAENRVQYAQASLKVAKEKLNDATIYSPVSGIILKKNAEIGEIILPAVPVYTIGILEKPWLKVYVKEDKLGLIKLGQRAEINVDSFPNKIY
ncbi:MAG: hypothetical protein A2889_03605, partial [Nitrospinae bacterium RIFCSPLOWO2_01_FULL_39_10]